MIKKSSRIRFLIESKTFLKVTFNRIFKKKNNFEIGPDWQNFQANKKFNYKYDCKNPRSFNEYLGWLKFNYYNPLWAECCDKLKLKDFLISHGFEDYVPETLFVCDTIEKFPFEKLPSKCFIKLNHDSGGVLPFSKDETNINFVKDFLEKRFVKDYADTNGEWVYQKLDKKVFAEEILCPKYGDDLVDYKLFVINGRFCFGFSCHNRFIDTRFVVFDEHFNPIDVSYIYLRPKKNVFVKHEEFDQMKLIAESIGKFFDFVRVDFYITNKGLKIGELTFFSQSGLGVFSNKKWDYKFGLIFKENFKGERNFKKISPIN